MRSSAARMFDTTSTSPIHPPLQLFTGDFIQYAVVFFLLAILAALVGARGVAGVSLTVAKWFVIIFVVLTVLSLVL
jgi:uncharacterized membrane protein YtjA (UPF0391 family)